MARRICLQLAWNPDRVEDFLAEARRADDAGVETVWVNEGFGHDAFSGLALLARETARVRLGTSIVNVFSRTPGALAQHFATIDQISGGRVIVGLGASAPGAIERFHGLPFQDALSRLEESVVLIRRYWRHERFDHQGPSVNVERALTMGVDPVQAEPPVYLATLHPRAVRLTAAIADGWLPSWIPRERVEAAVAALRGQAEAEGRPREALTVRSPASVMVTSTDEELQEARWAQRATLAFFVARNGPFYFRQFIRQGLEDEAHAIRAAWNEEGPEAAAALTGGLEERFNHAGPPESCLEWITEASRAGVDTHAVSIATQDGAAQARILRELVG